MDKPKRLYRFLPSAFVKPFVESGDVFFRNLSYFRKVEDEGRQDLLEGLHIDQPEGEIRISAPDGQLRWQGRAAFLNSINADRVFVFCLAEVFSPALFRQFGVDACVEILNPSQFIQRCATIVGSSCSFSKTGLLHGRVEYYEPQSPLHGDPKDPRTIPFVKHKTYCQQTEYRIAIAIDGGLQLTRRIVEYPFDFSDEVAAGVDDCRHIQIGSIRDIVKIRLVSE